MNDWLLCRTRATGAFDDKKKRRPTRHAAGGGDGDGVTSDDGSGVVVGVGESRGSVQPGSHPCASDRAMATVRMNQIRRKG